MSRDRWPLHLPCRLLLVLSALPGCLLDLQEVDRDCQVDTDCFADEVCDQAVQYCRRGERQCPPEGSWDLSDLTGRGLDARSGEQALGAPQSGRYAQHIALDDGSTWEGSCRWQA
ncbi:MAG: hypothetical protein FJ125_12595, partial [Deltaproteobacteria bacterium]|nr:hypothetical protein [Deltaproteobacteria bacterium]